MQSPGINSRRHQRRTHRSRSKYFLLARKEILIQRKRIMERTGAAVVLIVLAFLVASAGNLTMTMTHLILSAAAAL